MSKKKRTSNVVRFCSKHGRHVGFAWGGHRRYCQVKEVTAAQWNESLKGKLANANVKTNFATITNPARIMPIRKAAAAVVAAVVPNFDKNKGKPEEMVDDIQNYLTMLDNEESMLQRIKTDAEGKLNEIFSERGRIKEALKKLV